MSRRWRPQHSSLQLSCIRLAPPTEGLPPRLSVVWPARGRGLRVPDPPRIYVLADLCPKIQLCRDPTHHPCLGWWSGSYCRETVPHGQLRSAPGHLPRSRSHSVHFRRTRRRVPIRLVRPPNSAGCAGVALIPLGGVRAAPIVLHMRVPAGELHLQSPVGVGCRCLIVGSIDSCGLVAQPLSIQPLFFL
ncbi:hypothetical protein PF008_g32327 [Phytophthora fragariae]|uniref:Uncharacterized protein n=1 Tax=Phytophthora fragariae TaxID=53985 RepID=A0A6G0Q049_9STRA|nr:hypothetical protein PF008_g32327 [Phytophthora fragariae]